MVAGHGGTCGVATNRVARVTGHIGQQCCHLCHTLESRTSGIDRQDPVDNHLLVVVSCSVAQWVAIEQDQQINDVNSIGLVVERGSSVVECGTRNRERPGSNPPLLPFRRLGIFVLFTKSRSTQLYK